MADLKTYLINAMRSRPSSSSGSNTFTGIPTPEEDALRPPDVTPWDFLVPGLLGIGSKEQAVYDQISRKATRAASTISYVPKFAKDAINQAKTLPIQVMSAALQGNREEVNLLLGQWRATKRVAGKWLSADDIQKADAFFQSAYNIMSRP